MIFVASAGFLAFRLSQTERGKQPARPAAPSPTAGFLELEREAMRQDETTFAHEISALKAGQGIANLWDELRRTTNAWQLLRDAAVRSVFFPGIGPPSDVENGIVARAFDGAERSLSREEWRARMSRFEAEGYILEQSEWRQVRFDPGSNGPAKSLFDIELHVRHASSETRHQIAIQAEFVWGAEFVLEEVRVLSGRVVSRKGAPEFEPWFAMELDAVPGMETLDPFLAVYDLNSDLRPEIVVAVQNTVLRPKGERFAPEALCERPLGRVNVAIFGDFDADGTVDYLCADARGLHLFRGTKDGTYPGAPSHAWIAPETLLNPFVLTSGDADGDGDLDLFLAQYKLPYLTGQMPTPFYDANDGFPSFLLLNDGKGSFADATAKAGLSRKQFRRTYSASFADMDEDSDLDLIVVSDFYGVDLHINDGSGKFSDATADLVKEPHAFGMAQAIADFDRDGLLDILMIGMNSDAAERLDALNLGRPGFPRHAEMRRAMSHGNRLYRQAGGAFRDVSDEMNIAKAGWAWGVAAFDYDGDADTDVCIVNGHNSRASAMDYESQFWRQDVYNGTSQADPAAELFFQSFASKLYGAGWSYGGFHKNKFFINQRGTNFVEAGYLLGLALEEDCRNLARADLDGDGDLDLVLTTYQQWPAMRQSLRAFRNRRAAGAWTAVALDARDAPGAVLRIKTESGDRVQACVNGDSYRSQNPAMLWSPAASARVGRAEVKWPNSTSAQTIELRTNAIVRVERVRND